MLSVRKSMEIRHVIIFISITLCISLAQGRYFIIKTKDDVKDHGQDYQNNQKKTHGLKSAHAHGGCGSGYTNLCGPTLRTIPRPLPTIPIKPTRKIKLYTKKIRIIKAPG